jgi:hypothetical protein
MYTSSPGGIALQDYHWSGGFYSPNFLSYDKWGQSLPEDLYGFNSTNSEMVPQRVYEDQIQQFPIQANNYELLNTTSVPLVYERFESPNPDRKPVLFFILFSIALYLFDKTFENYFRNLNIYIKITLLVFLCGIMYVLFASQLTVVR